MWARPAALEAAAWLCAAAAAGGLAAWAAMGDGKGPGGGHGGAAGGGSIPISDTPGSLPPKVGRGGGSQREEPTAAEGAPRIEVYFGSQTGTAEEFAKALALEGVGRGYDMRSVDMRGMDFRQGLRGTTAIFLVATYGDGDPTDNAKECYKWLREEAGEGALEGTRFAVFGLGNTLYEKYNTMGKHFDSDCERLGGQRVFDLGLGDDDGSIQDDFDTWRDQLWPALGEAFGREVSTESLLAHGMQYRLSASYFGSEEAALAAAGRPRSSNTLDAHGGVVEMEVTENRELHRGGDRSCRHIELDCGGAGYETGDHVAVFPRNDPSLVEAVAARVGADLSQWICLTDPTGAAPFPCPCTVEAALSRYADISAPPKRGAVAALSQAAGDPTEAARLAHLASKAGREELYEHVVKGKRTLLDLLEEFPSVRLTLAQLLEVAPRLQPRYYSISSASNVHPASLHVTAVVVRHDLGPSRRPLRGVCTTYLDASPPGSRLLGYTRATPFKLPAASEVPVVMVGAGTGIAPLRGMIQHLRRRKEGGEALGENMLIFGCRHRGEDYLYEEEVNEAKRMKVLAHVHTAFSRDDPFKTVYVQNRVDEKARKILELLEGGGHFYVCGGAAMAKCVRKALLQSLIFLRNMRDGRAEAFLDELSAQGRYHVDVWS